MSPDGAGREAALRKGGSGVSARAAGREAAASGACGFPPCGKEDSA
jgi:hypothetical protein